MKMDGTPNSSDFALYLNSRIEALTSSYAISEERHSFAAANIIGRRSRGRLVRKLSTLAACAESGLPVELSHRESVITWHALGRLASMSPEAHQAHFHHPEVAKFAKIAEALTSEDSENNVGSSGSL